MSLDRLQESIFVQAAADAQIAPKFSDKALRAAIGVATVALLGSTSPAAQAACRGDGPSAGALVGAIAGGLIGSQVGKGDGRVAAAAVGGAVGALTGDRISQADCPPGPSVDQERIRAHLAERRAAYAREEQLRNAQRLSEQQAAERVMREQAQRAAEARCPPEDRSVVGPILGGVAGAILGNQVGGGSGKQAAAGVGAIVGTIVGDRVGNARTQSCTALVARSGVSTYGQPLTRLEVQNLDRLVDGVMEAKAAWLMQAEKLYQNMKDPNTDSIEWARKNDALAESETRLRAEFVSQREMMNGVLRGLAAGAGGRNPTDVSAYVPLAASINSIPTQGVISMSALRDIEKSLRVDPDYERRFIKSVQSVSQVPPRGTRKPGIGM